MIAIVTIQAMRRQLGNPSARSYVHALNLSERRDEALLVQMSCRFQAKCSTDSDSRARCCSRRHCVRARNRDRIAHFDLI
jgi:hypothetical protein